MKTQVINYGKQKLLLIDGNAYKLDSETTTKWAEEWFTKNWQSVKIIGGQIHLPSLAVINKAAADYIAHTDYVGRRNALAAIASSKSLHSLGLI
jgi:hypothetical protein